ncbi:MFS general substrate transporter [Panus rudis PR-1116 ss-1]|nr:MFS general substrate transporter [Panus rudis PR-1116 ss-1]
MQASGSNETPSSSIEDREDNEQPHEKPENSVNAAPVKPYSVFSTNEKWLIVAMASIGGLFSPLTSNSYFPAIPTISQQFHKSIELINLTVTVYVVFQGIAPMLWGSISDRLGRRPIFLICLLFLALTCVGVALTPTNAYWLLLFLRCLQAFGSASTIALGAGVIADVAEQKERGSFYGVYSVGPMVGPCIGPIIGGGLAQGLGWRSIFWFLCICSGVCLVIMFLIFPETLRALVGDGSIPPPKYYRAPIPIIGQKRIQHTGVERPPPKPVPNPFTIFLYLDISILLAFNGVVCLVYYGINTSIATLFHEVYPDLTETELGLCFLSIGGGMLLGGVVNGKILDREYRIIKQKTLRKFRQASPKGDATSDDQIMKEHFPLEFARFRLVPWYMAIFTATCIGYGWTLQTKVHIAAPIVLLFIMGYCIICIMNTSQTLIVDLLPHLGASATACNNLVRCSLSAAMTAVIDPIIRGVGIGWAYVILGAMLIAVFPTIFLVMYLGPRSRRKRRAKQVSQSLSTVFTLLNH